MEDRILQGEVQLWVDRGNSSGYGFILFSHGGPRLDRVFFSHDDITPDALGRRSHGHREVSVVEHILKGLHQPIASVFLKRSSGDKLYLSIADVAESHKERFPNLCVGDHVWHGVAPPHGDQRTWRATGAEFYSCDGELALREQLTC
jgi:hypothetical protein